MKKIRVLCLTLAMFLVVVFVMGISSNVAFASATPTVPTTIPNGNPVNVVWRGHAYPAIVGSAMLEAGWVIGDQMDEAGAYYMLMRQDGPAARWYLWIYDGGRDAEWGYWSYASAAHYYWNILGWKWALDDLEGAEDKVYNDLTSTPLPWAMQSDSYWLNNAGTYSGEYNDGWAQRFKFFEWTQGEGLTQWTTNPTFIKYDPASKWDLVNYIWDWTPGGAGTTLKVANDESHFALWVDDNHVGLSAFDDEGLDTWGEAARVTYGPFNIENHQYPYYPPPYRLTVANLDRLTIKGVVGWYWSGIAPITSWTGIKFDAWFSDPSQGGRPLVIEMYFMRTGLNLLWAGDPTAFYKTNDEVARFLSSGTIDDHLVNLLAFPGWCNEIGGNQIGTFVIDLKAIWLRAQYHFGRSNQDQLYAIALDLESGADVVSSARVFAEANEIKVTYTDPYPPLNPTSWSSSSHSLRTWSNDNTIDISWSGASDWGSGVAGYSIDWTTSSTTIPDRTVDTTATSATSPALSSGNSWYFHVRTKDNAGNWNSYAFHVGPFYIDTTPPSNPTSWSSSHTPNVWSSDNTIDVSWSGASDAHSGVAGYSIDWTTSSTTIPDATVDTTETSATSPALASGNSWYFHVRTKDNAGNWATDAFHVGPFYIDRLPKTPSQPSGPTTVYRNVWYTYSTSTTDPDGDDIRYEFEFSGPIPTVSFTTGWYASGETGSITVMWEPSDPFGTYQIRARAQDVYGWWSDWSSSLAVNLEPTLVTILNDLGFTNIEESTAETFIPGIYRVKLYAEFAGRHAQNELSWYEVGTTQYNLIFSGPEGNLGYVDPPIVKTFTTNSQFGLSFFSSETRYFTETSKNPDGIKHAMIYRNLDNPSMYLIGFENKLGGGDQDYNDMVISLEREYHDVAVTNVTTSKSQVRVGETVTIDVTFENQGSYTEVGSIFGEFNVTVYYDGNAIYMLPILMMSPGTVAEVPFTWNTTGVAPGTYTIKAVISTVPGETDTDDNTYVDGTVTVEYHDIAVTSVTASPTSVTVGEIVWMNVNARNEGDYAETFNLTVYYDDNIIETHTFSLYPGWSLAWGPYWITTGVSPGNYTIKVVASTVPGETDTADNTKIDGTVAIWAWDLLDEPWNQLDGWTKEGKGQSEIQMLWGKRCLYNKPDKSKYVTQRKDIGSLPETGYTVETSLYINSWGTEGSEAFVAFKFYDGMHLVTIEIHSDRVVGPQNQFSLETQIQRWYTWRFVIDSDADTIYAYRDEQYVGTLTGLTDSTANDGLVYCSWTQNPKSSLGCESYTDYIKIATGLHTPS